MQIADRIIKRCLCDIECDRPTLWRTTVNKRRNDESTFSIKIHNKIGGCPFYCEYLMCGFTGNVGFNKVCIPCKSLNNLKARNVLISRIESQVTGVDRT